MSVILVLGASGIVGQHMRLIRPDGHLILWHRRTEDRMHIGCDLSDPQSVIPFLDDVRPDIIINLAGENRVDVVEKDPGAYHWINAELPCMLAGWCMKNKRRIVTASSQAALDPVNAYGTQKRSVEERIGKICCVARLTYMLGVPPMPGQCRKNPFQRWATVFDDGRGGREVCDRWFSPAFASDAARVVWKLALGTEVGVVNVGIPTRATCFSLAMEFGSKEPEPVPYTDFPGAARPYNVVLSEAAHVRGFSDEALDAMRELHSQEGMIHGDENMPSIEARAREIALFLGMNVASAEARLAQGFGTLHNAVTSDFRAAQVGEDPDRLLDWYRTTEAYIWELSAYHADGGFNYSGMINGIVQRLRTEVGDEAKPRVLILGDGIGDATMRFKVEGFDAVYHDLAGSRTAEFAAFRYWSYFGEELSTALSAGWDPPDAQGFDAVVSLDFLEHLPNVETWARAAMDALKPGGVFIVQNAFAIGSGPDGSIPMHLSGNDRWEKDWEPMMRTLATMEPGNWWRKAK